MKSQASKLPSNVISIIKEKYPKFSKITLCMVNNPEYGVVLAPGAKKLLNDTKNKEKPKPKSKVVSARVDDDVAERLNDYVKGKGLTVNEFLSQVIKETVEEESMRRELSKEDTNV